MLLLLDLKIKVLILGLVSLLKFLIQLRDEYNKRYPDKIISNKPKTIWKSLQKKMKKCKSEMCWLNRLASSNAQVRLKKKYYSLLKNLKVGIKILILG